MPDHEESEIVITPPEDQFESFVMDLRTLRQNGAASNTTAILTAVHKAADMVRTSTRRLRVA